MIHPSKVVLAGLASVMVLLSGLTVCLLYIKVGRAPVTPKKVQISANSATPDQVKSFTKFSSDAEFKKYVEQGSLTQGLGYGSLGATALSAPSMAVDDVSGLSSSELMPSIGSATGLSGSSYSSVDRYSQTNVQVSGIDEPDIVKNDGENIFVSKNSYPTYYSYGSQPGNTDIIKALPASGMTKIGKIDLSGQLLLNGNILTVISSNDIHGYDITDKANPKEVWKMNLNQSQFVGARLVNDKMYLATSKYVSYSKPCPLQPFTVGGVTTTIPCTEIYHPDVPTPSEYVYTVAVVNISDGTVVNRVSFTGSYNSVLYMSKGAIYMTYLNQMDLVKLVYNFLSANQDLVPPEVYARLGKLMTYDLSQTGKMAEFEYIMASWIRSVDEYDSQKLEKEFGDRAQKYFSEHSRELESTSIVKISLSDFKIGAVGTVPGSPLNQYSLDEYNNNLRIAVTMGSGLGGFGSSDQSISDVYVLNDQMNIIGSIKDLGKGERIYSTRFIGDRGYVVIYKQVDPFYVLDLSNANQPVLAGQLQIPGYSSYLEPIKDHFILGIGKENNNVKLSLYDVSDPKNPVEKSKYLLSEYWSDALNNPHAFLKDDQKQIFFIPGSQGGYIFSYANDQLSLAKAVSEPGVERSLFINNTLYLVSRHQVMVTALGVSDEESQNKVTAWDESSWNKLGELSQIQTSTPVVYDGVYNPQPSNQQSQVSRDSRRLADLKQIQTALELYYSDNSKYPSGTNLVLGTSRAACFNSEGFTGNGCKNPYMGAVPSDPSGSYTYSVGKDSRDYLVTAKLEGTAGGFSGEIKLTASGLSEK